MGIEIERKYLVKEEMINLPKSGKKLIQGYLWSEPDKSLRIRIADTKAFLTIKSGNNILKRGEFEYEIPIKDANELLKMCDPKIEKTRYLIPYEKHIWEIDVFSGANKGLIVAEVELTNENEEIKLPNWIHKEVSHDSRYLNVSLIKNPFTQW
nr:CYTH domain-containing protein [uncultured Marinifilum sp.]